MKRGIANPFPRRKKIVIVDDHPIVRLGIEQLLSQQRDLEVCGEANTASQALTVVAAKKPDLTLADLMMPGSNGIEFVKDLKTLNLCAVLVLSIHEEAIYAERVLRAGARGFIMKSAGTPELLRAIRKVLAGQVYVSDTMSGHLAEGISGCRANEKPSFLSALTDREFEVFCLMGEGLDTRELGVRLHLSTKTIETHRLHIREKLRFKTGAELLKVAVQHGRAYASA